MAGKKIIYIISPRSAFSNNPGRKISSIIELWRKKYTIKTFFGGDILDAAVILSHVYGDADVYQKKYRKLKVIEPLVHSVSEIKDIIHNIRSYVYLNKNHDKGNIDLVWERSSRLHFAGLIFAKKHKIPYVLEWKDNLINYSFSLLRPIALYFERYKCKQADRVVVESQVLKDLLIAEGVVSKKMWLHTMLQILPFFHGTKMLGWRIVKILGLINKLSWSDI